MARIVCVHGIAQELKSRESLLAEWSPSLYRGVSNAGGHIEPSDVDMAFYGLLFRPSGGKGGAETEIVIPNYKPGDIEDPLEVQLLEDLFDALDETATEVGLTKSGAGPPNKPDAPGRVGGSVFWREDPEPRDLVLEAGAPISHRIGDSPQRAALPHRAYS